MLYYIHSVMLDNTVIISIFNFNFMKQYITTPYRTAEWNGK